VDHLARGLGDRAGDARLEQAEFEIGFGGSQLHHRQRVNDRHRHAVMADAEVLSRPFGLGTPIAISGDVDRAEAVGFRTCRSGRRRAIRGSNHEQYPLRRKPAERSLYNAMIYLRANYFLRKRSSRTTSAPSLGLSGSC